MKNKKLLFAILLTFLFLATFSFTYAYFSLGVFGNDEAKDITANTGTLEITYTDGPEIKAEDIYPGWSITKTFTVENTGSLDAYYSLNWDEITNTITNDELVMSMSCTGEGCKTITQETVGNVTGPFVTGIPIKPGVTHTYTITFNFLEMSSAQDYNQGKIFTGVINVEESSEVVAMYGTLVDSNDTPIPNATVTLHSNPQTTTTDSNGNFVFNNVEVSNHTLSASLGGTELAEDALVINNGTTNTISNTTITKTQTNNEIKVKIKLGNDNTIDTIEEVNYTLSPSWATTLGITKIDIIAIAVETTLTSPEAYTYNGVTYNRNKNGIDVSENSDGSVLASTYTDGEKDVIVMINSRGKPSLPENSSWLFSDSLEFGSYGYISLQYMQAENFNTSQVTNMNDMFTMAGSDATTFNLDLSSWDTSKVKNMNSMFYDAGYSSSTFIINLNGWNTSQVTDMSGMFGSAGVTATTWEIKGLDKFDTSQVTNMNGMFRYAGQSSTSINLDLSSWDTSKVTDMEEMFCEAFGHEGPININLSGWNTLQVTSMFWMLMNVGGSSTNINLSGWKTSSSTNMDSMFSSIGQESTITTLNLKGFNLSSFNPDSGNYYCMFCNTNSNAQIIVESNASRDWILNLDPEKYGRPEEWTASNIVVDVTP